MVMVVVVVAVSPAPHECAALYIVIGRRMAHCDIHSIEDNELLIMTNLRPSRRMPEIRKCFFRYDTKRSGSGHGSGVIYQQRKLWKCPAGKHLVIQT